jgi:hypothetical protein
MSFSEILEAADQLTLDEQVELSEILYKRAVGARRDKILSDIKEARVEYQSGLLHPQTAQEIMDEIMGEINE